jgi:hypothetical protein
MKTFIITLASLATVASLSANSTITPLEPNYKRFSTVQEFKKAFYNSHVEWFNAVQTCATSKQMTTKEGVGICLQTYMETRDIKESIKFGSYMVKGEPLTKKDTNALIGSAKLDLFITKECLDMKDVNNVGDVVECRKIIEEELKQ